MSSCDRCSSEGTFLYDCRECGCRYCDEHRAPADHLCISFPPLGPDAATGAAVRPDSRTATHVGRLRWIVPAACWLFGVFLVDHLGIAIGWTGTFVVVAFGSVALWTAAVSIPRVNTWMHAGG